MRKFIPLFFLVIVSCYSQSNSNRELMSILEKKITRIEIENLIFFGSELVQMCKDSSNRNHVSDVVLEPQLWRKRPLVPFSAKTSRLQ